MIDEDFENDGLDSPSVRARDEAQERDEEVRCLVRRAGRRWTKSQRRLAEGLVLTLGERGDDLEL